MTSNEPGSPILSTSMKKKTPKEPSEAVREVLQQIEAVGPPEEKVKAALEFMKNALTHSGSPRFKDFWDVRAFCLSLFKLPVPSAQREGLWSTYLEISVEARKLKEIIEEQSAFVVEQIELAVSMIEKDLENYDFLLQQIVFSSAIPKSSVLQRNEKAYEATQRELILLNALAAKMNALRKEVIKNDMRVKVRMKFFDRLSLVGDRIFPKRKELIKNLSEKFVEDIERFMNEYFLNQPPSRSAMLPYYVLREEIKMLQAIAKELTLSTQAFNKTREHLSQCWDLLRERDKKRREESSQKKEVSQSNVALVKEKIEIFAKTLQETADLEQANFKANEIYNFMRGLDLVREDVLSLKREIEDLMNPLVELDRAEKLQKIKEREESEKNRQEMFSRLYEGMQEIVLNFETMSLADILEKKKTIEEKMAKESPSKSERMRFEVLQKKVKDVITDKKTSSILNLTEGDSQALEQLKNSLQEHLDLREEVKISLENYRKALGNSGFDFEKAMGIREMIDTNKERLVKLNTAIQELENKIDEFSGL